MQAEGALPGSHWKHRSPLVSTKATLQRIWKVRAQQGLQEERKGGEGEEGGEESSAPA